MEFISQINLLFFIYFHFFIFAYNKKIIVFCHIKHFFGHLIRIIVCIVFATYACLRISMMISPIRRITPKNNYYCRVLIKTKRNRTFVFHVGDQSSKSPGFKPRSIIRTFCLTAVLNPLQWLFITSYFFILFIQ